MNLNLRFSVNFISLLLLLNIFRVISGQNIPSSPCPNIFRYFHNGDEWRGIINIDRIQNSETIIQVKLVVDTLLSSNYVGELRITSTNQQLNQPATYFVNFPIQNPLPKLVEITINNNPICRGQGSSASTKTNITLRNRLQIICDGCDRNFQPVTTSSPPFTFYTPIQDIYTQPPPTTTRRTTTTRRPPKTRPTSNSQDLDQICGQPRVSLQDKSAAVSLVTRGKTIPQGAWPWLAGIFTKNNYAFTCGGTLVSTRTVITAAHCYRLEEVDLDADDVVIALGRHHINTKSEGEMSFVSEIFIHPDWNAYGVSHDADIAITILQQRVQFSSTIIPACLWPSSKDRNNPTVVGWGRVETGKLSELPQQITTRIVSDQVCLNSNDIFRRITSDRTFCVGERNGKSPCAGDSGSGLLIQNRNRWYLRGVVAAAVNGIIGCDAYQYSVFSDVNTFRDFVRSNMVY